jgi:hypothetical protein
MNGGFAGKFGKSTTHRRLSIAMFDYLIYTGWWFGT